MDVKTLVDVTRPDDGPLALYCGKCGSVYALRNNQEIDFLKGAAEKCCTQKHCDGCGEETSYSGLCHDCAENRRFEKAEKISWRDYDGWVNVGDEYFPSIDEFVERRRDGEPLPAYVWACTETSWTGLDIERALESELEEAHEDAIDSVRDIDELHAFINKWNEKQCITSYYGDWKRAILLEGYADSVAANV